MPKLKNPPKIYIASEVRGQEKFVLSNFVGHKWIRFTVLQHKVGMDKGQLWRILKKLESLDLVEKKKFKHKLTAYRTNLDVIMH